MKYAGIFLALVGIGGNAYSAPIKAVCPDAKQIFRRVKSCDENGHFVSAAKSCLALIDLEGKKAGGPLLKAKPGEKAQNVDFKTTAAEYFAVTRKLDALIEKAEIARVDVHNYMEHLSLPEEEVEQEEDGTVGIDCFDDPLIALEEVAQRMDEKQKQFEAALEIAKTQLLEAQARGKALNNMGSIVSESTPAGAGPAAAPVGKERGKSGISERKKEK